MMRRLSLRWCGNFLRGWFQWGRGPTICADTDYSIRTKWTYQLGPVLIMWWGRRDWHMFCYTPEEAAVADMEDRE